MVPLCLFTHCPVLFGKLLRSNIINNGIKTTEVLRVTMADLEGLTCSIKLLIVDLRVSARVIILSNS